ncbi:MAG: hypothetical protein LWW86_03980 [Micrococcales bacterium]|nr:hypothetical protein [Micrococcales bacterium]
MSDRPFDQHESTSTKDAAAAEASGVAEDAKQGAQQVIGTAQDEAAQVAAEAKNQARDLLHTVRGEVSSQAGGQTQRIAESLRSIADELREMAQGSGQSGIASGLADQASGQLHAFAGRIDGRDPEDLLEDVRSFARRRPGAFLAGAAVVGLIGGRLTRGLRDDEPQPARFAGSPAPVGSQPGMAPVSAPAYVAPTAPAAPGAIHPAATGPGSVGQVSTGQDYSPTGHPEGTEVVGERLTGSGPQPIEGEGPIGRQS